MILKANEKGSPLQNINRVLPHMLATQMFEDGIENYFSAEFLKFYNQLNDSDKIDYKNKFKEGVLNRLKVW